MKANWFFLALTICIISHTAAEGMYFRAEVTNDSLKTDTLFFTVNLYSSNNDIIFPSYPNRTTWSSPFSFSGDISVDWLDTTLASGAPYLDPSIMSKYLTPQFSGFWDIVEVIYVESWADGLPDRFNFTGIANNNGYPPALGEIKIISWHLSTNSGSGQFCMDQGVMDNEVYDWLFDDPQPSFLKQCWNKTADTLEPISSVILNSLPDSVVLYENDYLSMAVHAFDLNDNPIMLYAFPLPNNAFFVDSGNGKGVFTFHPDYDQGSPDYRLYSVTFTASNGVVTDTEIVNFIVLNTDRPPILEYITTPRYIIEGQNLHFIVSALDPDSETVFLDAENLPANASFIDKMDGTGIFDFTPDTTQGSQQGQQYLITFRAIDMANRYLVVSQDVAIYVFEDSIPTEAPPVLSPIGNQSITEGDTLILNILASDPNNDPLLFSAAPLPDNAIFHQTSDSTARFIFLPDYHQAGTYNILFVVSDSILADSELVIIDVKNYVPPPTGYCGGRIIDTTGAPIMGAAVEFWINFPRDTLLFTTISDSDGQFICDIHPSQAFDIYAYAPRYYPGMLIDIDYPPSQFLNVVLTPVPPVIPTWESVSFFCGENMFLDATMPAGSVIDAYDADGIRCGSWYVIEPGKYGFMPVYRDDFTTPDIDEGADPGDTITFYINGMLAETSTTPIWTENGDRLEICLSVPYIQHRALLLKEGWNLVSWNIDTPDDQITTILGSVMDCIEVVLGFESGGFIYDPELPDFSTLNSLDHFHGYWIKMNCERELDLEGFPVAVSTPIDLEAGWNLVSYLERSSDSTPHALNSIIYNLDVALGYDNGALTYDPDLPEYSTLKTMSPGFGYWVKVFTDDGLVYPGIGPKSRSPQSLAKLDQAAIDYKIQPSRFWINLYSHNLTLDGRVVPEGTIITATSSAGTLLGAATIGANGKFGFMPVYGDDAITKEIDGLKSGEKFYLVVDGIKSAESFIWTENGDRLEIKSLTGKGAAPIIPTEFSLLQNYPNPFNPTTAISFDLPRTCDVVLEIYNITGQRVANLVNEPMETGRHTVQWDSRDTNGNQVATGIYLYRLRAGDFIDTKKMILLK